MQKKIKNQISDLVLEGVSVFELWEQISAKKKIFLANTHPCKYGALVSESNLDFEIITQQEGSELELMFLCPVYAKSPLSINLLLNLAHSDCKVTVHMVALVFSGAKTELNATIMMKPNIQNTSCALLEETVVLAPEVQLKSLPILDIHAKNIQASHGAKIYRLDQEKLFYLQSKGLSLHQAQQLILSSYTGKLFEGIPLSEQEKMKLISDFLTFQRL